VEDERQLHAHHLILAVGSISAVNRPALDGADRFSGDWYHTARWPEEGVGFAGKRVGVIGASSSGIQVIPEIARQADRLTVFQRTTNVSMPAHNRSLDQASSKR
jgi:cation diffusion facilitator CzcD-associated flavoprotein CzcO